MLAHVVQRVSLATTIDRVVVATTTETDDDAVAALAIANGAGVTRGSVDDVLSRYVQAAREHGADVVVRVSGDCPLIDPVIIDQVVRARADDDADYAENVEPPTYPEGYDVEALTSACLLRIDGEATQPYEREHVTPRIKEHRADFRTVHVACSRDLSWIELTVDVPQDLARVAAVLASLPRAPAPRPRRSGGGHRARAGASRSTWTPNTQRALPGPAGCCSGSPGRAMSVRCHRILSPVDRRWTWG